jgi:protein-tyrosine phosphatase
MLCALYSQGATRVVATPHFYAMSDEPERFLNRRSVAIDRLVSQIAEASSQDETLMDRLPDMYLGAEVSFFNAMSNSSELLELCLSGTKYLLVEMPFDRWTVAHAQELCEIRKKMGITPIIAHIDRYFGCFNERMLDEMIQNGVKVQINADAFLGLFKRRRSLELISSGKVHFLGSDSHNMQKRAPNIAAAVRVIRKRLGEDALDEIVKNSRELSKTALPVFRARGNRND